MISDVFDTGTVSGLSWPSAAHFATALQNSGFAFRDEQLKKCQIEKDERGLPRPRAGAFANVYQATLPGGRRQAIRVFTSSVPERQDRYQELMKYLASRRLRSLVQFHYEDRGIRSGGDGKWYPLITMDWVSGDTLFDWAKTQCLQQKVQPLKRVCELWAETIAELSAAKIAHGDLQHGNVMIVDNGSLQVKLVDYDCMCIPSLVGRKNLEFGVDPYQHPSRNADTKLSLGLDNFSALFIFVALRALAAKPDLWKTHIERPPPYDKLLFRPEDFRSPQTSPLMGDLRRSPDEEVRRLAQELVELWRAPVDQVPPLDMALFSWAKVQSLLGRRDFDLAVEFVGRNRKKFSDAPPPLPTELATAQQRIQQRLALERAVQAGDELAIDQIYQRNKRLLDDYPKASGCVAFAKDAAQAGQLLQQLQKSSDTKSWRQLVKLWDAHQALLANRPSAQGFAAAVNTWRQRLAACDQLLGMLRQPCPDATALEAAWKRLETVGVPPEAEPYRAQVQQLLARQRAWGEFGKLPEELSEHADAKLVAAWKEPLFAGWAEAERQRPRVEQARQRLNLLQKLPLELAKPPSVDADDAIGQIVRALPAGYAYPLRLQVEKWQKQHRALKQLIRALEGPSDLAIARAWRNLEKVDGRALLPKSRHPRTILANRRVRLLLSLKKIPPDYPPQKAPQLDPQILDLWDEPLLGECQDAAPWQAAHAGAVARRNTLEQLGQAIRAADKPRIADLAALLEGYPLPGNWTEIVHQAKTEVEATRRLLDVLRCDRRESFTEVFDVRLIRQNAEEFASYEAKLREWLPSEILPVAKLGLGMPIGRKPLVKAADSAATYQICWNWPAMRFSQRCLLALCRTEPEIVNDPRVMAVPLRQLVDRKRYEEASGLVPLSVIPDWRGCYVVVWALVDLGFQEFVSEPLVLGQIE